MRDERIFSHDVEAWGKPASHHSTIANKQMRNRRNDIDEIKLGQLSKIFPDIAVLSDIQASRCDELLKNLHELRTTSIFINRHLIDMDETFPQYELVIVLDNDKIFRLNELHPRFFLQ